MKKLFISYLKDGERLITDKDIWIICHPEDGEIIASSSDNELFDIGIISDAINNSEILDEKHITQGLIESIDIVWSDWSV